MTSAPFLPFESGDDRTLLDAFHDYHRENPSIYAAFCRFADEAIRAGRTHCGAKLIAERIRWYTMVEARSGDGFKLNNSYPAFYARMWLAEHPERPDFFETRRQRYRGADEDEAA